MYNLINNTVFQTVISGTLVFVLSQIIQNFFISPILKQRALINEISNSLTFYANLYSNYMSESSKEKSDRDIMYSEFRKLAAQISSTTYLIPCYNILSYLGISPKKIIITEVTKELIGLSNGAYIKEHNTDLTLINNQRADNIKNKLKI